MPQRLAAPPTPPQLPVAAPPPVREDRTAVRRAVRQRRRALAAELRRSRPRRVRAVPLVAGGIAVLLVAVPAVLAFAPVFTVQRIEVEGASPAVATAVQQALAGERGRPIALVETADVQRALRSVPAVGSAAVVRRPPSTLEVRVVPRVVVAQQRAGAGWQQVDASRVVVATTSAPSAGLPVVAVSGAAQGRSFAVVAAALAATGQRGIAVDRVESTGPDDVVLVLGTGLRVQWGGAEQPAAKAEALAAALERAAKGATEIDVSAPGVVLTR